MSDEQSSSSSVGLIIGFAVGAVLILLMGAGAFFFLFARMESIPTVEPEIAVAAQDFAVPKPPVAPNPVKNAAPSPEEIIHDKLIGVWEIEAKGADKTTIQFFHDDSLESPAKAVPDQKNADRRTRWVILEADGQRATLRRLPAEGAILTDVIVFQDDDTFTIAGPNAATYRRVVVGKKK